MCILIIMQILCFNWQWLLEKLKIVKHIISNKSQNIRQLNKVEKRGLDNCKNKTNKQINTYIHKQKVKNKNTHKETKSIKLVPKHQYDGGECLN